MPSFCNKTIDWFRYLSYIYSLDPGGVSARGFLTGVWSSIPRAFLTLFLQASRSSLLFSRIFLSLMMFLISPSRNLVRGETIPSLPALMYSFSNSPSLEEGGGKSVVRRDDISCQKSWQLLLLRKMIWFCAEKFGLLFVLTFNAGQLQGV